MSPSSPLFLYRLRSFLCSFLSLLLLSLALLRVVICAGSPSPQASFFSGSVAPGEIFKCGRRRVGKHRVLVILEPNWNPAVANLDGPRSLLEPVSIAAWSARRHTQFSEARKWAHNFHRTTNMRNPGFLSGTTEFPLSLVPFLPPCSFRKLSEQRMD